LASFVPLEIPEVSSIMAQSVSYTGDRKSRQLSTEVDNSTARFLKRAGFGRKKKLMDTGYTELYFVFGAMALILICGTVGLVLFVKYLNRDSRKRRHTENQK
jgi:hypothetical protein